MPSTYPTAPDPLPLPQFDGYTGQSPRPASAVITDLVDAVKALQAGVGTTTTPGTVPLVRENGVELNAWKYGVVADGVADDTAALNTAAAAAASAGARLYARGTIRTTGTVNLACDADLSDATVNYTGTGTAVQVGGATPLHRRAIRLPHVVAAGKVEPGWAEVAGSVGVRLTNVFSSQVDVPEVKGFESGLVCYGQGNGTCYNAITLGHLDNNKVNIRLDADGTGWCNQNVFLAGRCSHNTAEGTQVTGVMHVQIMNPTNIVNGNRWIGTSLESPNVVEYHISCSGQYNSFSECRFENTGGLAARRVRSLNNAKGNRIEGGFNSSQLTQVHSSPAMPFDVDSDVLSVRRGGDTTTPVLTLENVVSATAPLLRGVPAGTALAGSDPASVWTLQATAQRLLGKATADTFAKIALDFANGRAYFGDGTVDPTSKYLGQFGVAIAWSGAHLYVGVDNTHDIGAASSNRPRYVRCGTAVVTGALATGSRPAAATAGAGAMLYDTTLGKPIWSTGSAWVDATGATV